LLLLLLLLLTSAASSSLKYVLLVSKSFADSYLLLNFSVSH